jgi:uncharacterized membrane protein YdbT with pleckstrin-like domain
MTSYVESSLTSGEEILYTARLSLWTMAIHIALGVLLAVVLVGLVILMNVAVKYRSTEVAVTNKRVIMKRGFISRTTIEIALPKVESVQVAQSIWGRMFDFGSITISGAGNPQEAIHGIATPMAFRKAVLEAQEQV